MAERQRFVKDYRRGLFNMSELCAHYGVSRKTGYKWLRRYAAEGEAGLADRSRAPKHCPHQVEPAIEQRLVAERKRHRTWGPHKLLAHVGPPPKGLKWPAASTVGEILKRHELVRPRRGRARPGHPGRPQTEMDAPNAVWTADFKGHFKTGDGVYCYPLTVLDGYSRYLLACQALLATQHAGVQAVFERLFREYGLPDVIRTDNGVPFATQAIGRLSRLAVWWIKLGIWPELIEPGCPQQNGRHERLHRTLKAETIRPPAAHAQAQQARFGRFQVEYNQVRPHEALGQVPPAKLYVSSRRAYPQRLPELAYPAHFERRYVSRNGGIKFGSRWLNVSHVLAEEYVGLEEVADGIWAMHFGPLCLGRFDQAELKLSGAYAYNQPLGD
jgi:transposase InsO family protein